MTTQDLINHYQEELAEIKASLVYLYEIRELKGQKELMERQQEIEAILLFINNKTDDTN